MKTKILILALTSVFLVSPISAQLTEDWSVSSAGTNYAYAGNNLVGHYDGSNTYIRYLENGSIKEDAGSFNSPEGAVPTEDGGMIWNYGRSVKNLMNSSDTVFGSDQKITEGYFGKDVRSETAGGKNTVLTVEGDKVLAFDENRQIVGNTTLGDLQSASRDPVTGGYIRVFAGDLWIHDSSGNIIYSDTGNDRFSPNAYVEQYSFDFVNGYGYVGRYGNETSRIGIDKFNMSTGNLVESYNWKDPDAGSEEHAPMGFEVVGDTIYYLSLGSQKLKGYDINTDQITYTSTKNYEPDESLSSVDKYNKNLIVSRDPYVVKYDLPNNPPDISYSLNPSQPKWMDSVDVTASASDPDGDEISFLNVTVSRDGTVLNSSQASGDSINLQDFFMIDEFGDYNVTFRSADEFGAVNETSMSFEIVNQPPSIDQINTTPPGSEWIYGDNPDVEALISDRETSVDSASVVFLKNGTPQTGNLSMNEVQEVWQENNIGEIDERDTTWTVKVYATDTDGNTGSGNVSYFVEDLRPKLTGLEVKRNYFDYGRGSWSGAIKLLILGLLVVFGVVVSFF